MSDLQFPPMTDEKPDHLPERPTITSSSEKDTRLVECDWAADSSYKNCGDSKNKMKYHTVEEKAYYCSVIP